MVIVPAWIKEDTTEGLRAVLGSEPANDAPSEWIPRDCIKSCLYVPVDVYEGKKMAMIVFEDDKVPERIRSIMGAASQRQ